VTNHLEKYETIKFANMISFPSTTFKICMFRPLWPSTETSFCLFSKLGIVGDIIKGNYNLSKVTINIIDT